MGARPICVICGRPVERFEEREHFGRQRLVASCHGETQIVDLRDGETVRDLGVAFAEVKRLGA